jgi:hypothetical protein
VRRIIATTLSDSDIRALIELADGELAARTAAANLRLASMLLTASYIALRAPDSRGLGDYKEARDPARWRALAERVIARAPEIRSTGYAVLGEETDA